MLLLALLLLSGAHAESESSSSSEASVEEPDVSPQAAFDLANVNQMAIVVRADPYGAVDWQGVRVDSVNDAMVFTTTNPMEAFDQLASQADFQFDAVDGGHTVHFSYRISEPIPAQVRIKDDQSLWSAFVMGAYLDVEVPILYAEMEGERMWANDFNFDGSRYVHPTPEPTSSPTISGVEIDGIKYRVAYGGEDCESTPCLVWDPQWCGDRITVEDNGVSARMFEGNGHENTRTTECFSEGQNMWRLQIYTNDDERQTNVEWMVPGITTEGGYYDSYNEGNRSCGILAHSGSNYCESWGGIWDGAYKALPAQTTIELLLDCDLGKLTWRFFDTEDSFISYHVPQCDTGNNCLYPWIQMHYGDRHNQATLLGEPVFTIHNVWDDSDYTLHLGGAGEDELEWDEEWMGDRIRCEEDCTVARMHTGNGHENTRTKTGFTEGKNAWRIKLYANDDERNANAEWMVIGIVTEGGYFDSYNEANRSCGILSHSVTNYCNSWGYVVQGDNNQDIPSRASIYLFLDSDAGRLCYQMQGKPEPWVCFGVPAGELIYPWIQMHYGDNRQNSARLMGQMFKYENVNHAWENDGNFGGGGR